MLEDPNKRHLVDEVSIKVSLFAYYVIITPVLCHYYPYCSSLHPVVCNLYIQYPILPLFVSLCVSLPLFVSLCVSLSPLLHVTGTQEPRVYNKEGNPRIIAIDCGIKNNQIRCLLRRGCHVTVVPWNYDFNQHMKGKHCMCIT